MREDNIMANLLMFLIAAFLVSSVHSAAAKNRRGRQWTGELADPIDCSFPLNSGRNSTTSHNSPIERISFCNFTTNGPFVDGTLPWRKGLASLGNWLGGPETDASNSSDGGYAFFETSFLPGQHQQQQLPGVQPKAWLKSPVYQATTPHGHCLRFSYNIQGVSASKLRLLRVQMVPTLEGQSAAPSVSSAAVPLIVNSILMPSLSSQQKRQAGSGPGLSFPAPWTPFQTILVNKTGWQEVVDEVWLSSDSTRGQWLDGHVTYSSPYPHAFIFEAVPNLAYAQYRGHVAIDDIQFSNGPCVAECEFNADFCQWSNDPDSDFDWSLSRGSLWTSTGPLRDQLSSQHNFNFGGYAFIDSRHPHFAGSRASLTSDILPATVTNPQSDNALCFVFWVHMFGAGIGSLRVFQKSAENTSEASGLAEQEIWQLTTQSGPRDSWYRAQVTLASSSPFKIRLEATVGESGYGDIAVDSFRIENGSCPGLPEWAVNRGFDCTFQNGLCGWVLTNSRPGIASMWTRNSADIFSGRPDGHSQQNVQSRSPNSYMLFDTYLNGHKPGSRGFVSSQLQRSADPHCLSFWFYMASASLAHPRLGALEVVLFEPNSSRSSSNETISAAKHTSVVSRTLWRLENHQEEKWLSAQVSFLPASGGYISFVGIRGGGLRGIIAIDDVTLYKGLCQVSPADAAVSPLDCSFDQNLCNWSVDSQSVVPPVSSEALVSTEKEDQVSDTTEMPPTTTSRLDSEVKTTPDGEEPIVFPDDGVSATTDYSVASSTATGDVALPSTGIVESIELIPPQTTISPATEATTQTASQSSTTAEMPTTGSPAVTTEVFTEGSSFVSTTPSPTTSAVPTTTLGAAIQSRSSPTTPATSQSIVIKSVSENVNTKDSTVRGVSGLYDEITSFGGNTIEVISTSRDGATKSIIISQPVRNRFRRSGKWIGYNHPRDSRIVNLRSSTAEEGIWRRPKPVPHWLRSRHPSTFEDGHGDPYSVHQTFSSQRTSPPKLFGVSNIPRAPVSEPIPSHSSAGVSTNGTNTSVKDDPRWQMSDVSSSLYGVRDHTLQLAEGGYVFMEGKGKSSVSRLFSPPFPGNATHCLSFFFTMAYNSPNSTLTVYRLSTGRLDELWRVTSAAIDRSGNRNKSPWIPARVPIPSSGELDQTLVIEASTDSGGIGLDDVRFKQVSCSIRP